MTRLVTTGWETGDVTEQGVSYNTGTNSNPPTVVGSTPTPRLGGAYCLKVVGGTAGTDGWKRFDLPSALTDVYVRCGAYFDLNAAGSQVSHFVNFMQSSAQVVHCSIQYSSVDNQFRLYSGGRSGTSLATSAISGGAALLTWHLIEARCQMTSLTSGTVTVWVNGTQVINFTGDVVAGTVASVSSIAFGHSTNQTSGSVRYVAIDDIAINDTSGSINNGQIGDGRVLFLRPTGAGSLTQWTRGGTDSGANWSQLEETPPSMTDYVLSATVGNCDLYAITDAPSGTLSIAVVEIVALAQNSDAGAGSLGLTVKSGSTTNEATAQALSSGLGYYRARYETDPNTSAAWTLSALQALEAGVTVR